ncbi:hypothetical protein K488DRAFT_81488 [Vararia minispora EC-137]|uniref:Uncharacterized protein n=1 Tax=Vararia minispora EC-137 TaxID=1314806 RepID=A0ACB8QYU8_9AGAM|nr:hypothetical protein K488DRAFT_81488 [Vararia minispora EC-137]
MTLDDALFYFLSVFLVLVLARGISSHPAAVRALSRPPSTTHLSIPHPEPPAARRPPSRPRSRPSSARSSSEQLLPRDDPPAYRLRPPSNNRPSFRRTMTTPALQPPPPAPLPPRSNSRPIPARIASACKRVVSGRKQSMPGTPDGEKSLLMTGPPPSQRTLITKRAATISEYDELERSTAPLKRVKGLFRPKRR